jgi:hypothetical protein
VNIRPRQLIKNTMIKRANHLGIPCYKESSVKFQKEMRLWKKKRKHNKAIVKKEMSYWEVVSQTTDL